MNDDLNISLPPTDPPDAALLKKISAQMAVSAPTRTLPSNTVLLTISLALFAVVTVVIAAAVKFLAFTSLTVGEMGLYYTTVALFAALFARALIERMIPGEKRLVPAAVLWVSAFVITGLLVAVLFANYGTEDFVATGIPCLRLGVVSALISSLLGWRLLRRGYLVSPRETVMLYALFAGWVGIAVLALHCPVRNSLHFLVWHLGAVVLAGVAGLISGRRLDDTD